MSEDTQHIDIDYLAQLARLELSEDEKVLFSGQLADVLESFKQIAAVDVSGVEPTAHAFALYNVWDEDQARVGFSPEEALLNAPASREGQIVVPTVIET